MRWLCILTLVLGAGCGGFQAGLAKSHEALKAMSQQVEPRLAGVCLSRAATCAKNGVTKPADCPGLLKCRAWKRGYALGVKQAHRGLAQCNAVYHDLKKAGVISE